MTIRKNYGNNGIYGRVSNSAEAFGFLATLHSPYASLRSGKITGGYTASGVAPLPPKCSALPRTSYTRQTLAEKHSNFKWRFHEVH